MKKTNLESKGFYKMVLAICIPIVIQNGFTNLASLLDNIMIGQLGTLSMSGVSITNQLLQVFNVTIFRRYVRPRNLYGTVLWKEK